MHWYKALNNWEDNCVGQMATTNKSLENVVDGSALNTRRIWRAHALFTAKWEEKQGDKKIKLSEAILKEECNCIHSF